MQLLTPQQIEQASAAVNSLTPAQMVWVSGYLQGLSAKSCGAELESFSLNTGASEAQAPAAAPVVAEKITILYGSQSGNSRKLAEKLHAAFEARGQEATLQNMLNYRGNQLKKEENLISVISTHGNGEPPDEAIGFFKFLNSAKAPKLDHVKFSVLALGDSSYDEYCQTGYELDARLAELGATRLTDVVACDVDYADDAADWQDSVLQLLEAKSIAPTGIQFDQPASTTVESTEYTEQNPFTAEVIEKIELTDVGSDKNVVHVELSLEDSNLHYQPGDIATVKTVNQAELVDAVISELSLDANETSHHQERHAYIA